MKTVPEWFIRDYSQFGLENVRFELLPDQVHYKAIIPFIFTSGIILGRADNGGTYIDRWCYEAFDVALEAFNQWNGIGEPDGWHRHPSTGRRRPNGDVQAEYYNP